MDGISDDIARQEAEIVAREVSNGKSYYYYAIRYAKLVLMGLLKIEQEKKQQ